MQNNDQPPSASDERERFMREFQHLPVADALAEGLAAFVDPKTQGAWEGWQARAALAPSPGVDAAEHVAEVGQTFALHWAGTGSIAPLIERHGLKVGSKLYSRPAPSLAASAVCATTTSFEEVSNG